MVEQHTGTIGGVFADLGQLAHIDLDPKAWREGHDLQLERSVEIAMAELKRSGLMPDMATTRLAGPRIPVISWIP